MAILIAILTFLVVVALFLGVWLFAGKESGQEVVRRRIEAIDRVERRHASSHELQLIRDELLSDIPTLQKILVRWKWMSSLRNFLIQAGVRTRPAKILQYATVLGIGSYVLLRALHQRFIISGVLACVAAAIPFVVVALLRRRRFRAFEQHFPEALDLLGRAVRAGHAFSTGLEMIANELPDPVSAEFRATFEEQNFGLPFRDALINMAERMPILDVRFFVTAILIQKETGGNLAEILDTLARVIRDRFRIQREVRVRTAQGRLSAAILIALPPIMMVLLGTLNPGYIKVLFTDPWGPYILALAALLQIVGAITIWKIVNFEV